MFNKGDSVRRIRNEEDGIQLSFDKVYTVRERLSTSFISLVGHPGVWYIRNFEPAVVPEKIPEIPYGSGAATPALPTDSDTRKRFPLFSGLLAYFPAALAEVSNHSYLGNEKHNPGLPLQHARGKSGDHLDCVLRHIVDSREVEGRARIEELRAGAWRMLAELQEELERQGTKPAPAATFD